MNPPHVELAVAGVRLLPFRMEHVRALVAAADDPAIWTWWPRPMSTGAEREANFVWLLAEQAAGRWMAWTVLDPAGNVAGQSCYLALRPEHAGLEIGGTWYAASAHGGLVNPAAKLALLAHAFDHGIERVELKTDALNARSRAAISKLGAQFEGVFRHHLRVPGPRWRDTAWYSILREEWPAAQARLEARIAALQT